MSALDESEALRAYERISALLQEQDVDIDGPTSEYDNFHKSGFSSVDKPSIDVSVTASAPFPNFQTPMVPRNRDSLAYTSPYIPRFSESDDDTLSDSNEHNLSGIEIDITYGSTHLDNVNNSDASSNKLFQEISHHKILHTLSLFPLTTGNRVRFRRFVSVAHQAEAARLMAETTQREYEVVETSLRVSQSNVGYMSDVRRRVAASSKVYQEAREVRAERDLWSLLDLFSRSELLVDIDSAACNTSLEASLEALPASACVNEVLNIALHNDMRLRKGAVLREWLESCANDLVHEAPVLGVNWCETMEACDRKNTEVTSIHPDAQLGKKGRMIALEGSDEAQQTALLATIWALLRSGNLQRAQEVAYEHGALWLAASLSGASETYLEEVGIQDGPAKLQSRKGNARRPIWQLNAWNYANTLSEYPSNLHPETSAAYELSIFAALCGNTKALLRSPTICHWQDRLWVYICTTHERDLAAILERQNERRCEHSALYIDCETDIISARRELRRRIEASGLDASITMSDCTSLIALTSLSAPTSLSDTEAYLLSAQAAIICGRSGIEAWISNVLENVVDALRAQPASTKNARLMRVVCHFCLFLRLQAPTSSGGSQLGTLLSDEIYFRAIEVYISHLISARQPALVASYVTFLPQSRRLRAYANLLRTFPVKDGNDVEAAEALAIASSHFPATEVLRMATAASQSTSVDESKSNEIISQTPIPLTSSRRQTSGTQIIGHTQLSDSQRRPQRAPSQDSDIRNDSDVARMQRLQWLYHDPVHRLEAVRQTIRTLNAMMKTDNLLHARHLLFKQLPQDSEMRGWEILNVERCRLKDIHDRVLCNAGKLTSSLIEEQNALNALELQWESDLRQLWFWQRFLSAHEDADRVDAAVADINVARQQTFSRAQAHLERAAKDASSSLMDALRCGGSRPEDPSIQGAAQVWHDAEANTVRRIERLVRSLYILHDKRVAESAIGVNRAGEASFVCLNSQAELKIRLHALKEKSAEIFPDHNGADHSTELRRQASYRMKISHSISSLEAFLSSCNESYAADRADLRDVLEQCEEALSEAAEVRVLGHHSIAMLVRRYLDVCERTADTLARLVSSSGTSALHAHYWYSRGCLIADLLADSDPALELSSVLPVDVLKESLARVAQCALKSVEIRGRFDMDGAEL